MFNADRLEDLLACDGCDLLHLMKMGAIPLPAAVLGDRLARWLPQQIGEWMANGCPQTTPPSPTDYDLFRSLIWAERAGRIANAFNARRRKLESKSPGGVVTSPMRSTKRKADVSADTVHEYV